MIFYLKATDDPQTVGERMEKAESGIAVSSHGREKREAFRYERRFRKPFPLCSKECLSVSRKNIVVTCDQFEVGLELVHTNGIISGSSSIANQDGISNGSDAACHSSSSW